MKPNVFFTAFLLAGIFLATYGLIVGNPFEASTLDFRAFATGLLAVTSDTSDSPVSKLAVMVIVLALAKVFIWLVKRVLKA